MCGMARWFILMEMSLSVYIHFPYCKRKCAYCDFVSYADLRVSHREYIEGVISELTYFAGHLSELKPANTLYIGGGTPSLLEPGLVEKLIGKVQRDLGIETGAEITIEVNPGTVEPVRLRGYRAAGVNRISIGVQSMDPDSLKVLGRIHSVEENRAAFGAAREAGFETVGIDLIFGLPGQVIERWLCDLNAAISLKPDHVSAYILKAPENWKTPDEEIVSEMYIKTVELLESAGLLQYEVSNFACSGKESRHNSVYWSGGSYLGLGAAAHSYIANVRRSNETDIDKYMQRVLREGNAVAHCEQITEEMARDEAIMLGLRRRSGLDLAVVGENFGGKVRAELERAILEFERQGLGQLLEGKFMLNPKGMLLGDELAAILAGKAAAAARNSD